MAGCVSFFCGCSMVWGIILGSGCDQKKMTTMPFFLSDGRVKASCVQGTCGPEKNRIRASLKAGWFALDHRIKTPLLHNMLTFSYFLRNTWDHGFIYLLCLFLFLFLPTLSPFLLSSRRNGACKRALLKQLCFSGSDFFPNYYYYYYYLLSPGAIKYVPHHLFPNFQLFHECMLS